METRIVRKLWALYIVTLFLGSAFASFVGGTEPIISDGDEKEHWVVIICGGANDDGPWYSAGSAVVRNSSRHAYETFRNLGYNDDHIYYLHDRNISVEGADGIVNKSMVIYAITEWLAGHSDGNDDCCIVFNGHGHFRSIRYNLRSYVGVWNNVIKQYEHIFDDELATWLNTIEHDVCTVIFATACFSGSFIKSLSKSNRIIITEASPFTPGTSLSLFYEGAFNYYFFNKLAENVSYGGAWEYADKQLTRMRISEPPLSHERFFLRILVKCSILLQNPQIDDNGDRRGHGRTFFADKLPIRGDGYLALKTYP